ncbi:MAG TPA: DUF1684 domain-containing protein [Candidatus Polarisedimenticolia bacterium]|nr:DUF1684 domain-containing protein [Candidatus Polarisedimenticolia bacterium]
MMHRRVVLPAACGLAALTIHAAAADATPPAGGYAAQIETWRRAREERLRSDTGWLTVAGLHWLEPGTATFGSDPGSAIVLPASAPARAGSFELREGVVTARLEPGVAAEVNGRPAGSATLRSDAQGDPDVLSLGPLSMTIIERNGRPAVRLRDRESRYRREFTGLRWYPVKPSHRIEARWIPHQPPRRITVPSIIGYVEELPCPGEAVFTLEGREVRLQPVLEQGSDELFFIFKDRTSGRETYGAGRFLYAPMPEEGKVILDFNKAYNPPCAFTPYATCPLPPQENRLDIGIEAGELDYGHHPQGG